MSAKDQARAAESPALLTDASSGSITATGGCQGMQGLPALSAPGVPGPPGGLIGLLFDFRMVEQQLFQL